MTRRSLPVLIAGWIFLVGMLVKAQDLPNPGLGFPQIQERIQEQIRNNEIAGAVTMVVTPDKVLHLQATGHADREQQRPMETDSIFWIASMTKPIIGLAICKLQEEGKLDLNDPVSKHLPEFHNLKDANGEPVEITILQILTHTSGLQDVGRQKAAGITTLKELTPVIASAPVKFPPGSKWEYNQAGINTAGRIIEVLSGKTLDDYLAETFFNPLGMKDTAFFLSESQLQRLATTYQRDKVGTLHAAPDALKSRGFDPATRDRPPLANGGLFSTAPDYGRLVQMLLNDGELDGQRYLKPESVQLFRTIQTGPDIKTGFTPGNAWGVGCCIVKEPQGITRHLSPGTFGHGGAFGTQAWIDPVKKQGLILMVQRANFPNADASPVREAFQNAVLSP